MQAKEKYHLIIVYRDVSAGVLCFSDLFFAEFHDIISSTKISIVKIYVIYYL